tara:strand:+ start:156 stop:350 length:195 start_codon:yes stop_codon:yes gene_type:complete
MVVDLVDQVVVVEVIEHLMQVEKEHLDKEMMVVLVMMVPSVLAVEVVLAVLEQVGLLLKQEMVE